MDLPPKMGHWKTTPNGLLYLDLARVETRTIMAPSYGDSEEVRAWSRKTYDEWHGKGYIIFRPHL
jgi:hypothetical protein